MSDKTTKDILPARGLWAAVNPDGAIAAYCISSTETDAKSEAVWCVGYGYDNWSDMEDSGWRIIRVDVIPSEGQ